MTSIRIKRGMPLSLSISFENADGTAFDLSAVTLGGSVRDNRGHLVAALSPQITTQAGVASVLVASTASWPEGLLQADITVQAADGTVAISDAVAVKVERPVTELSPAPAMYDPVAPGGSAPPSADPMVPVG